MSQLSMLPSELSLYIVMLAENEPSGTAPQPTPDMPPTSTPEGGEQALETLHWEEVIELKTLASASFCYKCRPVEVFVGMEAVRASAESVPGLPSREELKQWLVEHDAIEKETEIFDSGELKTIKKFTKAATQRNLSPADTDLIELTLTTILELDKLLHLLRDRSENLELMGIRLSWEEFRTAAWIDLRTIIADLKMFLGHTSTLDPCLASDTVLASAGFSRSTRFKLAEVLSRDAAQFSARITALRHSKISAAGKMLDKLIDTSRTAVPEDLLDEQDRLEEKGVAELEDVGKFAMNAVMQWRKADEIYVESMKDQVAAQTLWDEIEAAKFQHPTARQSTTYVTRAETLIKRLVLRGDPASASSTFLRPTHVLFPENAQVSESVIKTLSSEIVTALDLARKAEAVHRVETLVNTASTLSSDFSSIIERLEKGVSSTDGDGTPPNLMTETCLEPTSHAAFLALLPSILKEQEVANESASQVIRNSRGALLGLDRPGIDPEFKKTAYRRIPAVIDVTRSSTVDAGRCEQSEEIRREVGESMEKHRWQTELVANGAPLTPESFTAPLPVDPPATESVKRLDHLTPLHDRLSRSSAGLKQLLGQVRQMADLLELVKSQANVMDGIRGEFSELQIRIDDLKMRVDDGIEGVLTEKLTPSELDAFDAELKAGVDGLRSEVKAFVDSLPRRVPFVSTTSRPATAQVNFVKRRFSSIDLKLAAFDGQQQVELPFDLQSLDDAVRADSNSYAMKLGGDLQTLEQRVSHFQLAQMAKNVDTSLSSVEQGDVSEPLAGLVKDIDSDCQAHHASIARSFSPIRELLRQMEAAPGAHDAAVHTSLYLARVRAVDDAEQRFTTWAGDVKSLINHVTEAHASEVQRLEAERLAEEQRLQRIAAEEAERARVERERLEEQERLRAEEERIAEERRIQAEKDRIAGRGSLLQLFLPSRNSKPAERERLELERLEEERRAQAERDRVAAEEAERARLELERLEKEEKLRLAQEKLAEERRLLAEQAERERVERERLEAVERARLERERLEKEEQLRLAQQKLAEEQRLLEERVAEQAEREHLEKERLEAAERERAADEARRLQAERDRLEEAERLRVAEEAERLRVAEEAERLRVADDAERLRVAEEAERLRVAEEAERLRVAEEAERLRVAEEAERARLAAEEAAKARAAAAVAEQARVQKPPSPNTPDHDVFGLRVAPSGPQTEEMRQLQNLIFGLRKRLRALSIEGLAGASSSYLPSEPEIEKVTGDFFLLCGEVAALPSSAVDPSVNMELNSLRAEVQRFAELVNDLDNLSKFSAQVHLCDSALSDLLEHTDTYPSAPLTVTSSFQVPSDRPAEEQLTSRLSFTSSAIDRMTALFPAVKDDRRAITERDRIQQTWTELEEMAKDRIMGRHSRPVSVTSSRGSGRNSSASIRKSPSKTSTYAGLSASSTAGPSPRARSRLVPPQQNGSRRSTFGTDQSRPASQLSNLSSNRSTSGPVMHGSTFASRQRTTSLTPSIVQSPRRSSGIPVQRTASPSVSDASSYSRSVMSPSRASSVSTSTWSRAPRYSLTPVPKTATPPKKIPPPRKKYVANPKSKLDIAVGDVINKLPVGISIEGVSDSWKDQSGKYWIGDQDAKLCFCRILRSQTVMVRVGGGWTELSKWVIKDHFADSFRLFADSPPRPGAGEPTWISSATLLEAAESESPPQPPRTPEPRDPSMPTFSILTPSGKSPQSLQSSPSNKGSPLTPLQFIRKAEPDVGHLHSVSPSKPTAHVRTRTTSTTPARNSIWRP
ncbi:hypothetical protein FB45DRAFT_1054825 [Roridomyces roridus]|uniref:GAR domain-containing protein n=1 Tax=Roridomyces roridus TaxID=1738132 RepID=A0AAD7C431_9AGAR|nr:hypothetical protein FB45DRAFT_1054825 [Roridomyces roridus]